MGRTLFVGDVHGCADALDQLLQLARPERIILLGDLFTKGPDPRGVWRLIQRWEAEAVLGNHDELVLRKWKPGKQLPRRAFRWLARQPLIRRERGWVAVHAGIHPTKGPSRTSRRRALGQRPERGQPWWQEYRGNALVIHGHHASAGLIDRRPWTLGLDTGCVSTGQLSGYLLEEDVVMTIRGAPA